jgi:hypothetical protein
MTSGSLFQTPAGVTANARESKRGNDKEVIFKLVLTESWMESDHSIHGFRVYEDSAGMRVPIYYESSRSAEAAIESQMPNAAVRVIRKIISFCSNFSESS